MKFVERGSGGGGGGTAVRDMLHAALEENIIGGGYLGECEVRMRPEGANQSGFLVTPESWGPCMHAWATLLFSSDELARR